MTGVLAASSFEGRRAMRDMVALSVLPALWLRLEPSALSESVADVLWNTLALQLVHVRMELVSASGGRTEIVRTSDDAAAQGIAGAVSELLDWELSNPHSLPNPLDVNGVRVARWTIRSERGRMQVAVARSDGSFPTSEQRTLLSVVANHAKTALQQVLDDVRPADKRDPEVARSAVAEAASPIDGERRRGGLAQWQLKRVTTYMRDNLEREIGLDEIADLAELSRFHFCKAFRRTTGHAPHEWLTLQRMLRARQFLTDANRSITQIALAVGYRTPSAFSVAFRRSTGMTPSQYRRRNLDPSPPAEALTSLSRSS
jgi:AraC-like DNA-binding protein